MKTLLKTTTLAAMTLGAASGAALADAFRTERVTFQSGGETLVGKLYVPEGVTANAKAEAVVVTGAWTTIKEQMAGLYAQEMANRGFTALAFDFRTWGESGGKTRSLEDPVMKIADIESAAQFLKTRPEVSHVNGLGICASAGYMAVAAERSNTLSAVALVAPWLHNAEIVEAVYGGREGVAGLIATGRAAAKREAETGKPQLMTAAGPSGSDALMALDGYYSDPDRGLIATWENTFNTASWEGWLTFDGVTSAAGISAPTLIVHSEAAAIPQGAKAFFAALKAPKTEIWLDDVSQFDFYDQAEPVRLASDAVAKHFSAN